MYEHLLKNTMQALAKSQAITAAIFAVIAVVLIILTRARMQNK